jgi:hypothetical protein
MERCSIDAAQFDELRLTAMARSSAGSRSLAAKTVLRHGANAAAEAEFTKIIREGLSNCPVDAFRFH